MHLIELSNGRVFTPPGPILGRRLQFAIATRPLRGMRYEDSALPDHTDVGWEVAEFTPEVWLRGPRGTDGIPTTYVWRQVSGPTLEWIGAAYREVARPEWLPLPTPPPPPDPLGWITESF